MSIYYIDRETNEVRKEIVAGENEIWIANYISIY